MVHHLGYVQNLQKVNQDSEAWVLDDHRFSLRLLLGAIFSSDHGVFFFRNLAEENDMVMIWDDEHFKSWKGAHLMEISRLEGLTTQVYAEACTSNQKYCKTFQDPRRHTLR